MKLPSSLERLITELAKLPGIGHKSAQKLAFAAISDKNQAGSLANALQESVTALRFCRQCFALAEDDLCLICNNHRRDQSKLCVVEEAQNVFAVEESGIYDGLYHVLGGVISPIRGVAPENLNIASMLSRLAENKNTKEIIIATNPTVEGEATAYYIKELLREFHLEISRLAVGMPKGGCIEYADLPTLSHAFQSRIPFSG